MRRALLLTISAAVVGVGCSAGWTLPDRTDPKVQSAERRLTEIVERSEGGAACEVRLLGESGGASFVWARCAGGRAGGASSMPLRIDGSKVTAPQDGGGYSDDVRKMFPEALADLVLEDQQFVSS